MLSCALITPSFTLDPREVDAYAAKLDPSRELVYRLAVHILCDRCGCRSPVPPKARTDERRFRRSACDCPVTIGLLAHRARGAHALTVDDHDLLDYATGLAEIVAEAANDPHLLRLALSQVRMCRPRAA